MNCTYSKSADNIRRKFRLNLENLLG
jgi:hypothetical protein